MEQRDVSQQWLEQRAGLGTGLISKMLSKKAAQQRGKFPRVETQLKICETLEIDFSWLSTGRPPRSEWQAIFLDSAPVGGGDDDRVAEIARRVVREMREQDTTPTSPPRHLHPVGGRKRPR